MRMSELHAEQHMVYEQDQPCPSITPIPTSLRDQIAIAAMQSLLLRADWISVPVAHIAQAAYIHADEMLAAREHK